MGITCSHTQFFIEKRQFRGMCKVDKIKFRIRLFWSTVKLSFYTGHNNIYFSETLCTYIEYMAGCTSTYFMVFG
jgi:hypothetical protein